MERSDFDRETFYNIIRKNVKKYRVQQGMTAAQLAERAGLGHDYLRQIESEKDRHHVSLISLYKISVALHVSMDALIADDDK
ncbi:MAG TPA: helix-turn-helix transcriptional regulator [Candidatus Flavonifractor avicola]|nr:helix-turn-helix transcriptional regulator [Candidatus Flavonifractor avicola]